MKKLIVNLLFILSATITLAQVPNFDWAKNIGGNYGYSQGRAVTVDYLGNVYATGYFEGTIDFDQGPGVAYLSATGGNSVYVTKSDSLGNLIWAKQLGSGIITSNSIAVYNTFFVYITGSFTETSDFDPGNGVYNLTSAGGLDIFISMLDVSGNFILAKSIGSTGQEVGVSVALDLSANVLISGEFYGNVDFDPGPGVVPLFGNLNNSSGFILKLAPYCTFIWAKNISGGISDASTVSSDQSDNVYIMGTFSGTTDFDPGPGIYNLNASGGITQSYVLKLNSAGNFIWAIPIGGSNLYASAMCADYIGNSYIIGAFTQTFDIDPGPAVYNITSNGNDDVFILKLDPSGNFVWANSIGSSSINETGNFIGLDYNRNVYCTGIFSAMMDFDPGPGIFNLNLTSAPSVYVLKLSNSGNFIWAKALRGDHSISVQELAIDANGSVYTTGHFYHNCDFDPGVDTINLVCYRNVNSFLSKLDSSGNFAWAQSVGAAALTSIKSMTTDANGNIYATGYFHGKIDFDPGPATLFLSTGPTDFDGDIFVAKYSSTGNLIWARQFGGTKWDYASSVVVDAGGNVYTAGVFIGVADFDPGTGTYNLSGSYLTDGFISKLNSSGDFVWAVKFGNNTTTEDLSSLTIDISGNLITCGSTSISGNGYQIFINKVNPSGSLIWTRTYGGTSNDIAKSVGTDGSGNVYITGSFGGTSDFDPGAGVYNMTAISGDAFVSKLNSSGNFVWAKQFAGTYSAVGNVVKLNTTGTLYIGGSFTQTYDFDPNVGIYNLTAAGSEDIFISKLDTAGNFIWAKQFAGAGVERLLAMTTDISENVYSTGYIAATTDFDPGPGNYNLSTISNTDVFISKLDASGNFTWAQQIGNDNTKNSFSGTGYAIALDNLNNIYTSGTSFNTLDFDPSVGVYNLTASGSPDLFIQKMNQCSTTTATITPAGNTTFCSGGSVTLNANTGTGLTYQWKKYGNPIAGATASSYVATGSGSYRVVVTNASGCSASASPVIVTVNPLPTATISATGSTAICPGSSVTLNANTGAGLNYQWKKYSNDISGATGANYAATGAGTYKVRVTDLNGCSKNSNSIVVTSLTAPIATITAAGATTFCAGDSVKLSAASGAGNTYQWRKGSSVLNGATGLNYYAKTAGNYKVTVTAANGCTKNSNVIAVNVPCRIGENPGTIRDTPFSLFPNPSRDNFILKSEDKVLKVAAVTITDLSGRKINASITANDDFTIEINGLQNGIYLLQYDMEGTQFNQRLVKIE